MTSTLYTSKASCNRALVYQTRSSGGLYYKNEISLQLIKIAVACCESFHTNTHSEKYLPKNISSGGLKGNMSKRKDRFLKEKNHKTKVGLILP